MLNIERKLLNEVWKHATEEYPLECCGVLLGSRERERRTVAMIVRCRNVHPAPATGYGIAPDELIAIQRDARDRHLEIVGFYHSHPDHPPTCSDTDLAEANWSECSYLILSVEQQRATAARSYVLTSENGAARFVEEALVDDAVYS